MKKFSRFVQRVLVIILSCALIGFMPPSISAAPKRVMLATTAYPPYYGELLPNQGVITEIIQEAFKHAEYGYSNPLEFELAKLDTEEVTEDRLNIQKLAVGRIDLALIDKIIGQHIIDTQLPESAQNLEWLDPPLKKDDQYLIFPRNLMITGKKWRTSIEASTKSLKRALLRRSSSSTVSISSSFCRETSTSLNFS